MEAQIANRSHSCKPSIYPEIEHLKVEGKNVFVVKVGKSDEIHSYKNIAYKRIGTHDMPMSPEEVISFARSSGMILFDSQICDNAKMIHVGKNTIKMFRERYETLQGERIISNDKILLENLMCIKDGNVTNSCILLFGKEPQKFFPLAYITVVRYPGNAVSDKYLDIKDFKGNLFEQIDHVDTYIKEHIQIASRLVSGRLDRENIPEYPFFAIREILVNAVAHRDYSDPGGRIIIKMFKDRIEYNSPGGFPPGITPENIANRQWSKNPTIVTVLNKVSYIEAIGDGIDRVLEVIKNHPLKPDLPKFEEIGDSVRVTLYRAEMERLEIIDELLGLNKRQRRAVKILREQGRVTSKEYSEMFNIDRATAYRDLADLERKNIVSKRGKARATYYVLK